MIKTNFHTHTVFCDGNDTVEELVRAAEEKGFDALGFSGHSYLLLDGTRVSWSMSEENVKKYNYEVEKAKKDSKIKIYRGIEQDYFSGKADPGYDYVIGSVHFILKDEKFLPIDESKEIAQNDIAESFGGDPYAYVEAYYALVEEIMRKTGAKIIGHFDIITKFNENYGLFDENNPRYIKAAFDALHSLIKQGGIFEVNTGAMARGYKSKPYPSEMLLREIKKCGGKIMLASDCHNKENLDYAFEDILYFVKKIGFDRLSIVTNDKINEVYLVNKVKKIENC